MGTLVLIKSPQKLECLKLPRQNQGYNAGLYSCNDDERFPGGRFGTGASSCTDRKNLCLYSCSAASGLCILSDEKVMESSVNFKLEATEGETGARGTRWSKSCLTQVIVFSKKNHPKIFNLKGIKEWRAQVPNYCVPEHPGTAHTVQSSKWDYNMQ